MLNILDKIKEAQIPHAFTVASNSSSKYSVNIVYNENGKRIALSKALSSKLGLTDKVYMLPLVGDDCIIFGLDIPNDRASKLKLNGKDKKICYNAGIVKSLVKAFDLNFDAVTSRSFGDIEFENYGQHILAIVHMHTNNAVGMEDDEA